MSTHVEENEIRRHMGKGDFAEAEGISYSRRWFCCLRGAELSYRRLYGGLSYAGTVKKVSTATTRPSLLPFCFSAAVRPSRPRKILKNFSKGV
jgi:hypothetical protein